MVSRVHNEVDIPVTCKIRVFPDILRTIQYAQMLEAAGCQLLTVHGRTKEQKGSKTGLASWEHIKAVKLSVKIPVFANGNIQNVADVQRCFEETGVDGVMIAEGSLHNPALFHGLSPTVWEMSLEYLEFVNLVLEENKEIRQKIATASSTEEFTTAILELKNKYESQTTVNDTTILTEKYGLPFPPWICQPYVRPPPVTGTPKQNTDKKIESKTAEGSAAEKRSISENVLSRKKLKKLQKNPEKQFGIKKFIFEKCQNCLNPKGSKCSYQLCKSCCRKKSLNELLDCVGHKFLYYTKNRNKTEHACESDLSEADKSILNPTVKENIDYPTQNAVL
ncbi:UNVERIFIED_CONTAM: tRNA-dihydrouridine(16/17) synthase [NAD(P)(+)]-like [Trichonephila clavipes]